jgi:hypothetical protein
MSGTLNPGFGIVEQGISERTRSCSESRSEINGVRQKLTGHADDATHQKYTHLELLPLQAAIATLPSVFKS